MAERRPPGFNVPLGFYDGPEVSSIPRRIRAAAVGVWTLCGTFSANKLQDGYVGPEALKQLGCTDAIRAALMSTLGPDGAPDPLWIPARDGGIQFTKWVKYQRTAREVKAYRDAEASRKRAARKAARESDNTTTTDGRTYVSTHGSSAKLDETSGELNDAEPPMNRAYPEMSGRTSAGHPPDHRDPKTETETSSYLSTEVSALNVDAPRDVERGLSEPVSPSASRIVHDTIRGKYPNAVLTALRLKASELVNRDGVAADVLAEAIRRWEAKPDVGPNALPMFVAEAVKATQAAAPGVRPGSPTSKAMEWQSLAQQAIARRRAAAAAAAGADPFDYPDDPKAITR
ncbi:RepA-like replication initiator [Mycobacterium phage Gravaillia]|uniref:Helix-turn-helix DNA binding domain protein n=2 Tax=Gilesvirus giles TaxID=1982151 RepID=A0A0K2CME3_9CAUD|nr:hypothetical protein SEA_OBUpride_68 [Mycobacterium phage OBUpride]AYB69409.1 hypothetical protein SEA_GANCHO_68 [Mycobacterium phage Gancho]WAB10173.1 RepA-like replication initiator [Mycobacterium phage Gravaillia]